MSEWIRAASHGELAEEESKIIEHEGKRIALFYYEQKYFALDDSCPHQKAPLSEGLILQGRIRCPLHASYFELETGKVHGGPCKKPVKIYLVRQDDDKILIQV